MERIIAENGVVYYRSELIPCIHGFSTRLGGVSTLPHTSTLNLGVDRGDDIETVLKNLSLFSEALGVDAQSVISVPQIHSVKIRVVTEEHCGEGFYRDATDTCDGYISKSADISLGVRTVDCVPLLIYAPPRGSFCGAVSALHAGWRGTANGIAKKAINMLCDMGADAKDIRVAIGPSIGGCCYTVRSDFYDSFITMAGKDITEEFVISRGSSEWSADLKGINRKMLTDCGVLPTNIDVSDACTCCEPNEFFSHRYSKGIRGTMLSVISKKKRCVI